jgi:hypothetical protein
MPSFDPEPDRPSDPAAALDGAVPPASPTPARSAEPAATAAAGADPADDERPPAQASEVPPMAAASPAPPEPFAIARWTVGPEYLLASYADWLAHLSRWVRHWPWIASLLALSSLAAGLWFERPLLSLTLSLLATVEVVCGLGHRRWWLRKALRGKRLGRPIELRFCEPGFELHSGDEGCCLSYALVREYTLTPSSLRLDLGGGMRFVVLDRDLMPADGKRQLAERLAILAGPATPRSIPVEAC